MSSRRYLDTNALFYAYQAGGISLIETYVSFAQSKGFSVVISDVVSRELLGGPGGNTILQSLQSSGVSEVATLEFVNYQNYLDGNAPSGYTPTNAGAFQMHVAQAGGV